MSTQGNSVSCLLPVKNGEDYLGVLIPSILAMLELEDEVIIVNDGSTDQTSRIIESYMINDKRIRLIQTEGIGLVSALNLGLSESVNPWIARFDVDDLYDPSRICNQRRLIADSIAIIFSDYSFMSHSGHYLGTVHSAVTAPATLLSLVSAQRTPHPVSLINREYLLAAGGYLLEEYPAEDLGLWLRISNFGELVSTPTILLKYRLSGKSVSKLNREKQLRKKDQLILNWSGWDEVYNNCLLVFSETTAFYLSLEGGYERILLHLRELRIVSNTLAKPVKISQLFKEFDFRIKIGLFSAGIKLIYWLSVRKIYRIFQK
jgi:glycosyltransferase involved in cell wall biosynthesis